MAVLDGTRKIPRTIPVPKAPDIKTKGKMRRGLADIDTADEDAMSEASAILQDIGQEAHVAGLAAIGVDPPAKPKPKPKRKPVF